MVEVTGKQAVGRTLEAAFERDGLALASRPQRYVDLVRRGGAAAEAAAFIPERSALWEP